MIRFKSVRWKNFLSTGNNWSEVKLDQHRTTILTGESGSGKSTLLDAITFALFNKPFRDINKKKIVNALNEKGCLVEVEFEIGPREYLIRRGIKPDIFEIHQDGSLINQDAANRDYQSYFERNILKFNFKSFAQIVVLGASNFTPFMHLKAADRRTIIEELLDIEIFTAMNAALKQRMSGLKVSIQETDTQIEITKEKIQVHEQNLKQLQQDNAEKIKTHEKEIEKLKEPIPDLTTKRDALKVEIEEVEKTLAVGDKLDDQIFKFKDAHSKLDTRYRAAKKEKGFYEENEECPTCKQSIDKSFCEDQVKQRTERMVELEKAMTEANQKLEELQEKKRKLNKAFEKKSALIEERSTVKNKLTLIEQRVTDHTKQIQKLQKPNANIKDEIQVIEDLKTSHDSLLQTKEKQAFDKNIYDVAQALLKDSGVKAKIIKQYLPLINRYVNKFLTAMNFFVVFSMDENFEEAIKSRGRDDFSYNNFSEGEKQRIDLALLFTWRAVAKSKNSVNTNLLILDEVFDSYLDNAATENVLGLLNSPLFQDTNIFVISHKETITDKFQHNLKFAKEKGFSHIDS